jgi:hypothetical protein
MSSLKTVQEEIEKALAATLRTRFNNGMFIFLYTGFKMQSFISVECSK